VARLGFKNKLVLPAAAGCLALTILGYKLAGDGHIIPVYAIFFVGLGFLYALHRMSEKRGQQFSRLESGLCELLLALLVLRIAEYHRQTSILMWLGSLVFLWLFVMNVFHCLLGRANRS